MQVKVKEEEKVRVTVDSNRVIHGFCRDGAESRNWRIMSLFWWSLKVYGFLGFFLCQRVATGECDMHAEKLGRRRRHIVFNSYGIVSKLRVWIPPDP